MLSVLASSARLHLGLETLPKLLKNPFSPDFVVHGLTTFMEDMAIFNLDFLGVLEGTVTNVAAHDSSPFVAADLPILT
jgi:hypothetical protein